MQSPSLGVCVVGCGFMGTIHALRWNNAPGAKVVAVADIDEARAETLARACGLDRYYTDYREAITQSDVGAVSVCVPTHLHPAVTVFAAEQGRHVICEKPIALRLEAAETMIEAANRHNVLFTVGFMRRHSSVMRDLRAYLGAGQLGRPVMYHAEDIRELRPKRAMHDADANGGPVIDMAVHLFDGWATMFDSQPVEVSAYGLKLAAGRPEIAHIAQVAYDTASINVRYASGDVGSFVVSWGLPPAVNPTPKPDQIYGPKGLLEVVFQMQYQEAKLMREGGETEVVAVSSEDMYQNETTHFANAILRGEPLTVQGADGKAALAVALAALESIREGRAVALHQQI